MQHREKSFFQGFLIYTVGNLGSKFINTILFPIFSFYILPNQMGIYDLSIVLIYLLIPVFTMNTRESAIRFLLDPNYINERDSVIKYTIKNVINGIFYSSIIIVIIELIHPMQYFWWVFVTFISILIYEIVVQIARGIGQTKLFVASGIMNTFFIASISILLVVFFKFDIRAVFLANIISRIICILIIDYRIHFINSVFRTKGIKSSIDKSMLKYALPLLPNFIMFWLIDNQSRIFINKYLGIEQNGLYAIVIKFSSILLTFSYIFYQTWQELSIKYYNSEDRNYFFTKVFNKYYLGLSLAVMIIGFGTKSIYPFIVDKNYHEGIVYIYPLLVSVVFYALAFFLDMSYQCSKESKRALPSIISTAILSVILNFLFIKPYGMMGITYALIISYLFLTIFRFIDSQSIIPIKLQKESLFATILIIIGWIINIEISNVFVLSGIALLSCCFFLLIFGKHALHYFKEKKISNA
ncbi:MAG: lipopolysaccharide biosynthesis protein [Bacteroidales bacterium]